MNRIITISFTPLNAPGGVPKFNRDLHSAFYDRECVHYSWEDFPWYVEVENQPEWEKARTLNSYLVSSRKICSDDVVIADGFWADGLQHIKRAVSHSHGIWSHLTKDDVLSGKHPENPYHHAAQVAFRQRWISMNKHITAVSDFIAEQMRLQWGFVVDRVINNGVDTDVFIPALQKFDRNKLIIVHGVNDRGNVNKGWDHIDILNLRSKTDIEMDIDVLSLDEMINRWGGTKAWALSQADLVVHPSGYEGNSMFVAESLSCGVPVIGYDVGYLWGIADEYGTVIDRNARSPEFTLSAVKDLLKNKQLMQKSAGQSRELAVRDLSIMAFQRNWRSYADEISQ